MVPESHHLFTSESVTEGHPDKVADQISDAILDSVLQEDPEGRVACETLVARGLVVLAGEITTKASVRYADVARDVVRDIGYDREDHGFSYRSCAVLVTLGEQSPDIGRGVDTGGAGDQGMMFGYACAETDTLMPMPVSLAHGLTRRLAEVRRDGSLSWLRPDGKAQVTVEYGDHGPERVTNVVVSAQHDPDVGISELRGAILEQVIAPVMPPELYDADRVEHHINPTGRFVIGGPMGDSGVTGRKIIVDTYGGVGSHGGGAFSGKDPSKVDRSASYAARWVAKNIVASGLAQEVEIQLAYAIGVDDPVSVMVNSFGTGTVPDTALETAVRDVFDLKPRSIIQQLDLKRPIFRRTASYGHFGRQPTDDGGFSWERLDRQRDLLDAIGV
ncbi:MAG: methionine adenosyltransferase [Candidatus Palauibacterales bacterium]|nr:methionine adenosyltransferase [Candidatus Palauibacterales bacterium]